ncbi:hypothetical protein SBRCBS47491_008902 [Sporothrix bragantina]|uniref:BTB domain transcription factor n=1 Tax=Sporothrix bragantina TaxID=671064 RepID=A0ABP0CRU9_9PEZI
MVATRNGSRTDGAVAETAKPAKTKKSETTEKPSRKDETGSEEKTEPEVKSEPTDVQPSVEETDNATAGDKHERSRSPEDGRKRQKKEDTVADIKKEEETESKADGKTDEKKDEKKEVGKGDDAPSVLEKGNIYFFFRARVNIDEPHSLDDVARTYIILKPRGKEGKESKGSGHCRLLALPKKVLPRTGRDRFMAFVLKADASYAELEKEFLTGSEPENQSNGNGSGNGDAKDQNERHYPAATAFGEGVYAIIGTSRESHLAYVLSVPENLGAVQKQMGLTNKQGCFIVSAKNPAFPMPGGAKMVGGGPNYPKEVKESFHSLRWAPMRPEHIDYANSHLLLIGESKGTDSVFTDDHAGRELSAELEELADDDINRMRRLGSTEAEAVFASLHAKDQAEGQPDLAKTFG